jgi:endonuclease YncB( thermonuclease family)
VLSDEPIWRADRPARLAASRSFHAAGRAPRHQPDRAHRAGRPATLPRLLIAALGVLLAFALPPARAEDGEIVPPPSRDVTPPGVTPAPAGPGPLIREAVPPPPPAAAAVPLPAPPVAEPAGAPHDNAVRWHRFVLPETTDAGTFVVRGRTFRIAGVAPLPRAATCRNAAEEDWPCGDVALDALRHFLLGRPVECWFVGADPSDPQSVPCRVGKTDLGAWLLAQGWARAAHDASRRYRRVADDARCAGRGLWHGVDERPACMAISSRSATE